MTLVCKYGIGSSTVVKPYRDVLQRWRKCLASLLFFAIVIMDNVAASAIAGLSHVYTLQFSRNPWIRRDQSDHFGDSAKSQLQVPSVDMMSCAHDWKTFLRRYVPLQQCLFINDELVNSLVCEELRPDTLHSIHLRFCAHYSLAHVFNDNMTDQTFVLLKKLQADDDNAREMFNQFRSLMARYDCLSVYSVQWNCQQCKEAYRDWVCAMKFPANVEGRWLKPCRSYCHKVEQQCPYFHPRVKEQYAGEPVFKCIDPNIPDSPNLTPDSVYGQPNDCYGPENFKNIIDSQDTGRALTSGASPLSACLLFFVTVLCYSVLYLPSSWTFLPQTVKPP